MAEWKSPGPVSMRFLASNSPVRIIQGPIESAKSSTSCMALYRAICTTPRSRDGKRRSRWLITRNCYDADTEVLAERGWVKFADLMEGERVAQLRDGRMEFVAPTYYYRAPYSGDLVGFEGEGVDFRVTPDHRMWVSRGHRKMGQARTWGEYQFAIASDIYGNQEVRVRRDAEWEGNDRGHSEAFFEWLGFWFAEGSTHKQRRDGFLRAVITQKKPAGIEYARRLFFDAGIPFYENTRADGGANICVRQTPETEWLRAELALCGKATAKSVLPWMKNAPPAHLRAFIRGYVAGDGYVHKNGTQVAFTSSCKLADDLQEMALRAGMVANIASRDRRGSACIIGPAKGVVRAVEYTVTFVRPSKYRPQLRKGGYANKYRGWYKEHYEGEVYCIEVPTHVIYVRRNGKAFWCSQTYPDLRGSTVETFLYWFPPEVYAKPGGGKFLDSEPYEYQMRFRDVVADVVFESFLDDRDEVIRSLRSKEYTGAWVNETQFMPRRLVTEIASRTGRYPPKREIAHNAGFDGGLRQFVIADLNAPASDDHWILRMRGDVALPLDMPDEEKMQYVKPAGWEFFHQPPALLEDFGPDGKTVIGYRVNPAAENIDNMRDGVRSTLEMKELERQALEQGTAPPIPHRYIELTGGKTKDEIDRDLMGRVVRVKQGKPVFSARREQHVCAPAMTFLPGATVVIGLDFGLTPAAAFMQQIGPRWYCLDELIGVNIGADQFAPMVKNKLALAFPECPYVAWGDPAGGWRGQNNHRTPFQIFAAHGINVRPPALKDNPEARINATQKALSTLIDGAPRLMFHPRCKRIIEAVVGGAYVYRVTKSPDGLKVVEEPVKNQHSHPAEAAQYALWGGGEVREMLKPAASARPSIINTVPKKRGLLSLTRRLR